MKIDAAIRQLQEAKDEGAQNIIFAFWESDNLRRPNDATWAAICDKMDYGMDWSDASDQLSSRILEAGFEEADEWEATDE